MNRKDKFDELFDKIEMRSETATDLTKERVWKDVEDSLYNTGLIHTKKIIIRYVCIAATLLFVSLTGLYLFFNNTSPNELIFISNTTPTNLEYNLADGTEIILRPHAQLSFISGNYPRNIAFNGEGYFRVSKNKNKPFIIQTDAGIVSVYGTEFNLQSIPSSSKMELTLIEGAVGFTPLTGVNEYTISPSERLTLDKLNSKVEIERVNTKHIKSWIDGYFTFENEPFNQVIDRLSSLYSTPIVIGNRQLHNIRLTGRINLTNTIEEVIESLKRLITINYHKEGPTLFIN